MKESKKIERLFQEKFKDFEATPPSNSWNAIASKMNSTEKEKKKLPFFFTLSHIAASIVLIGFLSLNYDELKTTINFSKSSEINSENKKIVEKDESKKIKNENKTNNENNLNNTKIVENNSFEIEKNNSFEKKKNGNIVSVDNTTNPINDRKNKTSKYKNLTNVDVENIVNSTINKKTNKNSNKENINNKISDEIISSNNSVSNLENQDNNFYNQKGYNQNSTPSLIGELENQENNFYNQKGSNQNSTPSLIGEFNANTSSELINNTNDNINSLEKLVFTDIAKYELADSIQITLNQKIENPLEILLREIERKEIAYEKEERSKWALGTTIAPVYFNSIEGGSPIDPVFKNSSKDFRSTTGFGLNASYDISKRLSVKSGINFINMNYLTNDVAYQSNIKLVNSNPSNINRNQFGITLAFTSKENMLQAFGDIDNFISNNIGSLRQEIGYVEVPMELGYKFVDKKLKIELIGGFSTLFLSNNSISLIKNDLELEIGKASNLNKIHFSSNVGLGFKYSFWKAFSANFQPMFKYQINPFSQNAGDFRPYFIGLNTGLSYQF